MITPKEETAPTIIQVDSFGQEKMLAIAELAKGMAELAITLRQSTVRFEIKNCTFHGGMTLQQNESSTTELSTEEDQ